MYRVQLDDGRAVRASLAPPARHGIVRLIEGDRVEIQLTAHDPQRGNITKKL